MTTPRHGDRPFEIAHIDHTELDVELICSQTRRNLGRPWLTLLMDAFSRRLLAVYLTFDPPSYRSCMMVFRECVRRHHRLPQTLVMDGGREFDSIFFETLLAYYGITKKTRPASKARFGSICERLFGSSHTRFIYNLIGNTQLAKENVRFITKEVDPKHLAVWTFGALMGRLEQWAYEVYDTLDHPALGQSPRDAFQTAQTQAGARLHRVVAYNEEFEMLTLPTTTKGTARVVPGRGVLINSIYYWSEALRRSSVEGAQVPVRYDPFNLGRAFVYAGGYWHQCLSQHYLEFRERTEREVMIAAAELRRRNRLRGVRQAITASRLAAFLKEVQDEEAILQQRLHDAEERRARQPQAPHHPPATISQVSQAVSPTQETVTDSGVSTPSVATAFDLTETPAPENLDLYEAY